MDVRPTMAGFAGEIEAVSATGHLYVREEQPNAVGVALEQGERLFDRARLQWSKAGFRDDVADDRIIVRNEGEWRILSEHPLLTLIRPNGSHCA